MEQKVWKTSLKLRKTANSRSKTYCKQIELPKVMKSQNQRIFQKASHQFQSYLMMIDQNIEKVCEKENYRNYLNQQNIQRTYGKLLKKKMQLEKLLIQKKNPSNSINGSIHQQIENLKQLAHEYQTRNDKLTKDLSQKKHQKESLTKKLAQHNREMKDVLITTIEKESQSHIPNMSSINPMQSHMNSHRSSRKNSSRKSIMGKLEGYNRDLTKERIDIEQEKLIVLKLIGIYLRSLHENGHKKVNLAMILSIQSEEERKRGLIEEIKKIMADE